MEIYRSSSFPAPGVFLSDRRRGMAEGRSRRRHEKCNINWILSIFWGGCWFRDRQQSPGGYR